MTEIHPNYAKAAKLMLISYAVSCIAMAKNLWSLFQVDSVLAQSAVAINSDGFKSMIMIAIITNTVYFFVMSYLIRQGYDWMKYLLLGFLAWMIFDLATSEFANIVETVVDCIIILIRIWMIVLLFQIPKIVVSHTVSSADEAQ